MKKRKAVIGITALILTLVMLCGCGKSATENTLNETASYLQKTITEPNVGSVGGEWLIVGLVGSGCKISANYADAYYERLCERLNQSGGVLDERKYSEYSRVILAVTAIGKDPTDVCGYDLTAPLGDFDSTEAQGINGPIWTLIALNVYGSEPPETDAANQGTRETYLNAVLRWQTAEGGWGLMQGENDIDLTAMALQALAPYKEHNDVADAIAKGMDWLSSQQLPNGGFYYNGNECLESVAQTIIALYELGIDINDARFVKNDNTLLDALMQFKADSGGFSHTLGAETDEMATEQAFLALTEIVRAEKGKSPLFQAN